MAFILNCQIDSRKERANENRAILPRWSYNLNIYIVCIWQSNIFLIQSLSHVLYNSRQKRFGARLWVQLFCPWHIHSMYIKLHEFCTLYRARKHLLRWMEQSAQLYSTWTTHQCVIRTLCNTKAASLLWETRMVCTSHHVSVFNKVKIQQISWIFSRVFSLHNVNWLLFHSSAYLFFHYVMETTLHTFHQIMNVFLLALTHAMKYGKWQQHSSVTYQSVQHYQILLHAIVSELQFCLCLNQFYLFIQELPTQVTYTRQL